MTHGGVAAERATDTYLDQQRHSKALFEIVLMKLCFNVRPSTTLFRTEIPQQLFDELPCNFVGYRHSWFPENESY